MKAIEAKQYGGEEQLHVVDVPKPAAGKGQLIVRILATSLNPIDPKRISGNMRQVFPVQFPFVPGGDFSGIVDSVGEDVSQFREGDEVWGYTRAGGAYAEYLAVDANEVALKPKTLNHIEAASLALVGQTALEAVDRARVQKGQTVFVQGAGGAVGSVVVQESHRRGAKVIGTATHRSADRLKSYGAEQVIDYDRKSFESVVHDVDAVIDCVGGDAQQYLFEIVKRGGVLVSIVQPPSEDEAKKRGVKTSWWHTDSSTQSLEKLAQLVDAGEITPFVRKVYPLSEAAAGWQDGQTKHADGKIVFKVAEGAQQEKGRVASL